MNTLGILSLNSQYIDSTISAYKTSQTTSISKQDDFGLPKKSEDSKDDIVDTITISSEAMQMYEKDKTEQSQSSSLPKDNSQNSNSSPSYGSSENLTKEQEQEISKLKARDTEVKAHEQAHLAAAAGINASPPSYTYQVGPDGKQYAVGGEVNVSFKKGKDHNENIRKAETMKRAALAPSDPSSQDLAAAQSADAIITSEEQKIKQEKQASSANNSTQKTSIGVSQQNIDNSIVNAA